MPRVDTERTPRLRTPLDGGHYLRLWIGVIKTPPRDRLECLAKGLRATEQLLDFPPDDPFEAMVDAAAAEYDGVGAKCFKILLLATRQCEIDMCNEEGADVGAKGTKVIERDMLKGIRAIQADAWYLLGLFQRWSDNSLGPRERRVIMDFQDFKAQLAELAKSRKQKIDAATLELRDTDKHAFNNQLAIAFRSMAMRPNPTMFDGALSELEQAHANGFLDEDNREHLRAYDRAGLPHLSRSIARGLAERRRDGILRKLRGFFSVTEWNKKAKDIFNWRPDLRAYAHFSLPHLLTVFNLTCFSHLIANCSRRKSITSAELIANKLLGLGNIRQGAPPSYRSGKQSFSRFLKVCRSHLDVDAFFPPSI